MGRGRRHGPPAGGAGAAQSGGVPGTATPGGGTEGSAEGRTPRPCKAEGAGSRGTSGARTGAGRRDPVPALTGAAAGTLPAPRRALPWCSGARPRPPPARAGGKPCSAGPEGEGRGPSRARRPPPPPHSSLPAPESLWEWRGISSDRLRALPSRLPGQAPWLPALPACGARPCAASCPWFLPRATIADLSMQRNTSSSSSSRACAGPPALGVLPASSAQLNPHAAEEHRNPNAALGHPCSWAHPATRPSRWPGPGRTRLHTGGASCSTGRSRVLAKSCSSSPKLQEPAQNAHVQHGKKGLCPVCLILHRAD